MKYCLTVIALVCASTTIAPQTASSQDAVLAEIYGRGVHSFYAGRYDEARQLFSSAINAGSKDPRAYYFRGIVSTMTGSSYEAESDWQQGAQLEASGKTTVAIGRSLSRFQGSGRLKLEQIRQAARLQALMSAASRSNVRMNEIRSTRPGVVAAPGTASVTPPPTPPAAENPFKDDAPNMAMGDAKIVADDALKGTLDPLPDDGMADVGAGVEAAGDGVFGGASDAPAADPFGGAGGVAPAADPFGGGGDAMADPFGGGGGADPFGN
ncbi:hypothetical protein [Planctomycetes bacterium K23_9]|uniref:Uncharacterized protein n=1 Tax=Stieleria marina TaxID=1930275 RepID=A0A517P306_9BACT|nr:hypothetical protein K239x_57820 [Planctomycetes bacterium K23_9]